MKQILIKCGTVVSKDTNVKADIVISEGVITGIMQPGTEVAGAEIIDAAGKYILPGLIDSHVHFHDPGITHREDLPHGTMAAAVGGVTTAISHPLNIPPIVDRESYEFTMDAYRNRAYIDYGIHGGGVSTNIDKIREMWNETGATSVKMFTCFSVADFPYVQDDAMLAIFRKVAEVDGLVMVHAENNELIKFEENRLKSEGRKDPHAHVESHTELGELEAVRRVIFYLEATGAKGLILHTTMTSALEEIRAAKNRGVKVYAETCPHLLTFNDQDINEKGPFLKFTPVMRDEANRKNLWKLLNEGYVDTIGSDHSPYLLEEKTPGIDDIWKAPNGIPGVQTSLITLLNGVSKGLLTINKLVEVTSFNPARLFGLDYRKGQINIGFDADLVIVDMDKEKEFTEDQIMSKAKWSPYTGMSFKGWPVLTMVRGVTVAKDGVIVGSQEHGQYIPRKKA